MRLVHVLAINSHRHRLLPRLEPFATAHLLLLLVLLGASLRVMLRRKQGRIHPLDTDDVRDRVLAKVEQRRFGAVRLEAGDDGRDLCGSALRELLTFKLGNLSFRATLIICHWFESASTDLQPF